MSTSYYTRTYYSAERPSTLLTLPLRKVTTSNELRPEPSTTSPSVSTIKPLETTTNTLVVTKTDSVIASSPTGTDTIIIPPHAHPTPDSERLPINSNEPKPEARLSTPQIAGIATSAIAILVLVAISWLILRRRKRWQQMREAEEIFEKDGEMVGMGGEALPDKKIEEMPTGREAVEVSGLDISYEMPTGRGAVEVSGLDIAYEMPATPVLDSNRKNGDELTELDGGKERRKELEPPSTSTRESTGLVGGNSKASHEHDDMKYGKYIDDGSS
ncbi:hypothetical protein BJ508DRAFT_325097 [Ascobolus immersus RN42]|uniref:Uncharacterized protein n=1 Tax=Ascobolus immersus RN42 TaxID=1160509 RepID=A0A3N4IE18_ASCIM|nr:hypothetical protein BJ508DRAFT_325097 [Ascobolus immersus RN42]